MITIALAGMAVAAAPMLGGIGRQDLPQTGCAAYLWSASDRRLVAMASAAPARLRIALDGRPLDLARGDQRGEAGYGLAASTDYRGDGLTATLDLTVATRADLTDGAAVPQASLRVVAAGRDELVVPLGGMIGCRR